MLAGVAGYVDAAGFLMTGGYFVSFMSGNSTRLGVGIVRAASEALLAASLVGAFVAGVALGAVIRRVSRRAEASILAVIAALLGLCAYFAGGQTQLAAALLLASAMGAENTIFAEGGEVRIGLTYMTGALVKVGKGLVAALFGESHYSWAPHLMLWLGLVAGGALGAAAFSRLGLSSIWFAAAVLAVLAPVSLKIFQRPAA